MPVVNPHKPPNTRRRAACSAPTTGQGASGSCKKKSAGSDRTRRKGPRDAHGPSRVGGGRERRFDARRGGAFLVSLPREGIRGAALLGPLNKSSHAPRPCPNAGECVLSLASY